MTVSDRWLLPDGVDELLPPEAGRAEELRRMLLDTYRNWGYELIAPPMVEYLESLLTGTGNDLALQTFKVTDQLTGRLMGVRADITPQAARIDAHSLHNEGIARLCYADTVVHTKPSHPLTNRAPYQLGCELFGSSARAADIEIISLMLETLALAGQRQVHIDLAHVGIYRGLVNEARLDAELESQVFDAVRRGSLPELDQLAEDHPEVPLSGVWQLARLSGGADGLERAQAAFAGMNKDIDRALADLEEVATAIRRRYPKVDIGFDFCELRGYNYHTGLVFAAFVPGCGQAVAQGGRYDHVGEDFGRGRPATGFSCDLKSLVRLSEPAPQSGKGILAPLSDDPELVEVVRQLRRTERVIQQLPEQAEMTDRSGCDRELVKESQGWIVRSFSL